MRSMAQQRSFTKWWLTTLGFSLLLGAVVCLAVLAAYRPHPLSIIGLTVVSILFGVALAPIARAAQVSEEKRQARRGARIAARDSIPIHQLYMTFYAGSNLEECDVTELWLEVADTLHLDPEKMRPTDRFDKEYAPVGRGWARDVGDELEDLEDIVAMRCHEHKIKRAHARIERLDDYIRIFSGKCP